MKESIPSSAQPPHAAQKPLIWFAVSAVRVDSPVGIMRGEYTRGVRVLLAPHGTRGDVQPMLALAIALRARGHAVSFVAPDNAVAWLASYGFYAAPNAIDVKRLLRAEAAVFDSLRWQARHFADVLIPTLFDTVARAAPDADLIVASGVQMAAASIAEARGIPCASAVFCPCAVPSGETPPPTVRTQTLPSWLNRALWTMGRPFADWMLRRPVNRQRARLGLPPDPTPLTTAMGELVIVAADRDLAPLADDVPERVVGTDAWIVDESGGLDDRVRAFLAAGPPPVYLGFGSMIAARASELALQALAAIRSVGARAIVAGGWAELDPHFAAVVHHGGAGTTTAAARAARPQVVVPHILDQFYWAHRVEVLGVGPRAVLETLVTADILAERVDRALNDPRIAGRAAALGGAMAARNGVDAAVELLETLV